MHPFVTAELMVGAVLLSVGLLYGVIALRGYRRSMTIPFALASFFGAVEAFSTPLRYLAGNVPDVVIGMKIAAIAVGLYAISLVWFAAGYGGDRKRRIPVSLSIYGLSLIVLEIVLPAGLFYQSVSGLRPVRLPWGEMIVAPVGKLHPLQIFPNAFGLLGILYLLSICIRLWRGGERRRAVSFGWGLAPLLFAAYPHGFLVNRGILPPPHLYSFSLLSLVLIMKLSLVKGALRSEALAKEVECSERRWRSLLEGVSLLVAGCDATGHLTYVNPFMEETTGYRKEELLGRDSYTLISPKDRARLMRDLEHAFRGEISPRSEFAVRTKSGADRIISWSNVLLYETSGPVSGILSVGVDITERMYAEQSRDRALKELLDLKARLETENTYLKLEIEECAGNTNIIGQSDAIRYVLQKIKQVAPTDATVLIEGETGVGKELVARALHEGSQRARYPFLRVNCGALAPTLIESELFGHEKGAFTGADRLRKGRFELAEGGTLFLDEIGELPLELQCKLLRILQEGEYERVGGSETRKANVRIIAATNKQLQHEIAIGRFREDLFYRLQVYPISVPPLRERREDIPLLVEHFARRLASKHGKTIDEIPGHMMRRLADWDWPGNVRELENVIERAVIITRSRVLAFPDGFAVTQKIMGISMVERFTSMSDMERKYIMRVLDHTHGRVGGEGGAAEILGLHPNTLRSRMAKLGVGRPGSDSSNSDSRESALAAAASA